MNPHRKFIETPVSNILKEAVQAINPIGSGIETYPLYDYVMQSVFIKMTGAQEQKLKCIAWELATNDAEFRREFFREFNVEFSSYDDKNKLYQKLLKYLGNDFPLSKKSKKEILEKSNPNVFRESNLTIWINKSHKEYQEIWSMIKAEHFALQQGLLLESKDECNHCLQTIYKEHLYRNRNRIAHNTKSFQQNLPTLERLKSDDYQYENYFLWFSILILIDKVFIALYKEYLKTLEQKTFI